MKVTKSRIAPYRTKINDIKIFNSDQVILLIAKELNIKINCGSAMNNTGKMKVEFEDGEIIYIQSISQKAKQNRWSQIPLKKWEEIIKQIAKELTETSIEFQLIKED